MDTEINHKRDPNPRQNANIFSIATFSFTLPLFLKGRKKDLGVEDLFETWDAHQTSKLAKRIEAAWQCEKDKALNKKYHPSLGKALIKTHAPEFVLFGLLTAFNELVVKMVQPLALGELINYYTAVQKRPVSEAYLYAGAIVGCALLSVLLSHPAVLGVLHCGMKLRVACNTLVYRKTLKMSQGDFEQISAGKIINLVANDVNRFDQVAPFLNSVWIGPIQTVIITYFIYREVGVSAILGMIAFLLFIPMQFIMGKLLANIRYKIACKTDERVRIVNEIISGIQVIKMYAWEVPYQKIAELTRRNEIAQIKKASYVRTVFTSLISFPNRIGIFATILIYMLYDNTLTARQAFIITAYYNVIKTTMAVSFPLAVFMFAEVTVSVRRINEFLLTKFSDEETNEAKPIDTKICDAVVMKNSSAKWEETPILCNISMTIQRGSLVAIVGNVGSGKSSIFQAILRELPLTSGILDVNGKVSYASQQPWLFTGSVRQNILFNSTMDKLRYKTVTKICALKTDFTILPYSDKTIVGERGVSLSGGQRARINLARAVYNDADIYLLDDPLSAVDPEVGKQLFDECIRGFLSTKTVILITHQLQFLKDVHHIVVMESGSVKAEGSFKELQAAGVDFTKVLEQTEECKEELVEDLEILKKRASVESTVSLDQELVPGILEETTATGTVSGSIYGNYIRGAKSPFLIFLTVFFLIFVQIVSSVADYFITFWTNMEQKRQEENFDDITDTKKENDFWNFSTNTCVIIYSALTVITFAAVLLRSLVLFRSFWNASKMIYQRMFSCIIRAKLLFFNTNPSGRILNRFSNDIGLIDEKLPMSVFLVLQLGLSLLAVVVMVGVIIPWLLVIAAVIAAIVYVMAVFYLKTSRNVKRVEGVTRSPVYAHINASIQGLPTIRAFNAAHVLEKEFDKHQDLHSSAWYSFISSSTAFGYWLDLVALIYIAVVTFSFIVLGNEQYGGNVGLAISQAMILTGMFQMTMKEMTEVENLMTSIERITEYTTIESEPPLESSPDCKPPESWPSCGKIEFKNTFLKYSPVDPPVLKDLNFTIQPLEKVGIVGRTGAGKSSLIAALFRLSETEGSIVIDGIDTNTIGLHDLRSKISIIPQEPVLFSGTMRRNLDPFNDYSDSVLWNALDEVELKEVVSHLNGGLEASIQEGGTNLSVGQRQLVCLARALIRNNKILVLDEATANVDPQTDILIQKTIRNKFDKCTVLTIAHRLNTVMDSDKVLVMDSGRMVEFDHPHTLLQNENGHFYSMVHQSSKGMSEMLTKIAKRNYKEKATDQEDNDSSQL